MADKQDLAQERTDWAEDRTDWAEDRTILAQERTYAGWLRTGLAVLVVALGLKALFVDFEPKWVPRTVSASLCGVAVLIFAGACGRTVTAIRRLNVHAVAPQGVLRVISVAVLLSLAATAIGVILWFV